MEKRISKILSSYPGDRSDLIPILQDIQSNFGYLPEEILKEVSSFTRVPESEIYGVASFYSQFSFTPKGKNHIMVCTGTACHVKGADQIKEGIERHLGIEEGRVTPDLEYSIESVGCLGCCALAPCATVNDEIKSNITLKDIKKIFRRRKGKPHLKTIFN
ncbi:NADH-quinone oxidoreductase subunit NuoE [Methanobacterium ferruginis]|uniref:NADH-quinone oxidoreductase subunit NuoE n=1 Tax=Methanobacterium ferruginis TaxID=710191 RepID=UPI002572E55D|nr:NADH-quinone oxidoreductase subunit NuoE [Methanobacterium ferruginis]BDZ66892.1 NADH-quinone oxidoreductase subunit E [Methanobacterium ferruginis]